ncbi:MAG: hypothetical protein AAF657_03025 [Acidobacteriota bacterium]
MADSDPRRLACDQLAESLATPEGLRTARLLQLTEALATPELPSPAAPPEPTQPEPTDDAIEPRPISIWQPREREGRRIFERPEPLPLGDHHAARRRIDAEKAPGVQRICFFGESVAAGYLYAPRWTPAEALQGQLGAAAPDTSFEVIDLARTNETLAPLVATVERSLQLDPDVLVLFAGNNWNLLEVPHLSPYVPSIRGRQRHALACGREGGPARLAERQIRRKVRSAMAAIARLTHPKAIPVVLVIPEVNLADWQDRQPVPWLAGDGSRRWYALYDEAIDHLAAERFDAALAAADTMLELDGGRCATTHRLRCEALVGLGQLEAARRAAEAEVASSNTPSLACLSAPRATRTAQDLLRQAATRHGFTTVDLPALFAAHTGSPLPGRRLFLDYCHLTAEGIGIAMAATAAAIIAPRRPVPTSPRPTAAPVVPPAVEALAQLGGALHSAHRLLPLGGKRRHLLEGCRAALAADPNIADAMVDLLHARCAPCPAVLTCAQERNLDSPHRLLLQHGWRWDGLDIEMIEALRTVLGEVGRDVAEVIDRLLVRHHAVGRQAVDLTRPPYLWEPLEQLFPAAMARGGMTGRAMYRSLWPQVSFCLIADGEHAITLELTARLPQVAGAHRGRVTVRLNEQDVASLALDDTWAVHELRLETQHLRRAINRITLAWPPLPASGDAAMRNVISRLQNGLEADLHPIFGEIFSLRARIAD